MEATFPHYTASSIPSDSTALAQYAQARGLHVHENSIDEDTVKNRPTHLTIPHDSNDLPRLNETTPLLNPSNNHTGRPSSVSDGSSTSESPSHDAGDSTVGMFKHELWTLIKYSLPVFGTYLLEYSLVTASVVSIGHLSTTALAGITLGSMTASVSGLSIMQGMSSVLDTMLPSAWTSPQPQLVGLWCQRMAFLMGLMLIPILTIWFNAEHILLFLHQDPEVAHLAMIYLRYVSLGAPAYAFNCISRRYFQCQGLFDVPTRIIFVVAPINAFLNWLLVWGPEPVRLGFIGAPIATALSFNIIALLSILYGLFYVPKTAWHPWSRKMFTNLGVLAHLGLAGVAQTASEWWAWELIALVASMISPVALAAQSILFVSASTTFQAPYAVSLACSVRIGNLLGERRSKRAEIATEAALTLGVLVEIVNSAIFFIFRTKWGYLFSDDINVVKLVAHILPVVALFQVFDGVAAVTGGILRARGRQVTGALLNLSAYYIIGIPLGLALTFPSWPFANVALGLLGLWLGLTVSLIYCAVLGAWICLRTDWIKEVVKVKERLDREKKIDEALRARQVERDV